MRYVICYDTPCARRRNRIAKAVESCGFRVQYSVFEADLTPAMKRDLVRLIEREIEVGEDSVRIYPICESCAAKIRVAGVPDPYQFRSSALLVFDP